MVILMGKGSFEAKYGLIGLKGLMTFMRPPLNKKLFPVHRPSGLKRAEWDSVFSCLKKKKKLFDYPPPHVHFSLLKKWN